MYSPAEHDEILNAVESLLRTRGIDLRRFPDRNDSAVVLASGHRGSKSYELRIVGRLGPDSARALVPKAKRDLLVVAPYISGPTAAALERAGIDYVDAAGNTLLRWDALLMDVRGRARGDSPFTPPVPQSLIFNTAGVRVVFALLSTKGMVSQPLRVIASVSRTSLGSAQAVVSGLQSAGYVLSSEAGGRTLLRTSELLDRWVEAYIVRLDGKLGLGRFRSANRRWWLSMEFDPAEFGVQLGGESAAWEADPYLEAPTCTLYADGLPRELVVAQRLQRVGADAPADVVVREKFWRSSILDSSRSVPVPLVYADLLASGEPRQREAAARLRREHDELRRLDRS